MHVETKQNLLFLSHAVLGLTAISMFIPVKQASAQSIYSQNATITANATTISGQYLPIVVNGVTSYYNFTTTIAIGQSGAPVATTVFSASPALLFNGFQAGTYVGYGTSATLNGPGIGPSGSTEWTWQSGGVPFAASWYVGPISKNPLASRIAAAGIKYTGYSYGVAGDGMGIWGPNCLIGASQTGNGLTLVSFSNSSCTKDFSLPQGQESWKLN